MRFGLSPPRAGLVLDNAAESPEDIRPCRSPRLIQCAAPCRRVAGQVPPGAPYRHIGRERCEVHRRAFPASCAARDGLMSFEIDVCRFLLAIRAPTLDCALSPELFHSRGTHPTACP
jgi:hypothetical protein